MEVIKYRELSSYHRRVVKVIYFGHHIGDRVYNPVLSLNDNFYLKGVKINGKNGFVVGRTDEPKAEQEIDIENTRVFLYRVTEHNLSLIGYDYIRETLSSIVHDLRDIASISIEDDIVDIKEVGGYSHEINLNIFKAIVSGPKTLLSQDTHCLRYQNMLIEIDLERDKFVKLI